MMDIQNKETLIIRPTSNGVIVAKLPDQGYPSNELAVFNDPDDMADWIKAFFLNVPDNPDNLQQ